MSGIRIDELKGFLKTAGEKCDSNNDREIKGEKEISAFTLIADQLAEVGLVDKDYKETLGLHVSNPNATKNNISIAPKSTNKKLTKYEKECQKAVLNNIKSYEDEKGVTLSNLYETISDNFTGIDYERSIKEMKEVIDLALASNFDSKDKVKAFKKSIRKNDNLSDFQKSLADEIAEFAKKEEIAKETTKLVKLYNQTEGKDYTARLNTVKAQMQSTDYSKEAFKGLEAEVSDAVANWAQGEMENLKYDDVKGTKKKHIKSEIKDKVEDSDKFAKKVIEKMDIQAKANSNRLKYEKNYDTKLTSISKEDLRNKLGEKAFHVINGNFLDTANNGNDTYNMQIIADVIKGAIGADWEMDYYEDNKKSEMQEAISNLKELIDRKDLTTTQVEKLKKLCNIQDAPKDRSLNAVFGNAKDEAIAGAAVAAALAPISIENIAIAQVGSIAEAISKQVINLAPAAVGAIPIEIALDALVKVIFGVKNGERTCFDYKKAEGKTLEEYISHLSQNEDETKAKAIAVLAKMYNEKYGDSWNIEFMKDMKDLAGNDVLNCKEFINGKLQIYKKLNNESSSEDKVDKHTYSTFDIEGEDPTYEKEDAIDGKSTTWPKVASQYPCLVQKYGEANTIRMIKIAQAIKGDYSEERLVKLLEQSKQGLNAMRNVEGLDFEVYKQFYNGTVLPNRQKDQNGNYIDGTGVKMPKKLAGCDRDCSISLKVNAKDVRRGGGKISIPNGHIADRRKTSEGSADRLLVKFDNGIEKNCNTEDERNKEIDIFKKKYGAENVIKTPWEQGQ